MEIEQTPLRTAIMRITSDMLDSPDKHGIYETGRFMDRIEQLMCDMMAAPEVMQLSGSEAVMGFLAWLTTRDETTVFGPSEVVDIDLYARFVETNNLTEPRESWHELLIHPEQLPPKPVSDTVKLDGLTVTALRDDVPEDAFEFEGGGLSADIEMDFDVGMPDFPQPDEMNKGPCVALFGPDGEFIVSGSIDEIVTVLANKIGLCKKS